MTLNDRLTLFRLAGMLQGIADVEEREKIKDVLSDIADEIIGILEREDGARWAIDRPSGKKDL